MNLNIFYNQLKENEPDTIFMYIQYFKDLKNIIFKDMRVDKELSKQFLNYGQYLPEEEILEFNIVLKEHGFNLNKPQEIDYTYQLEWTQSFYDSLFDDEKFKSKIDEILKELSVSEIAVNKIYQKTIELSKAKPDFTYQDFFKSQKN